MLDARSGRKDSCHPILWVVWKREFLLLSTDWGYPSLQACRKRWQINDW